MGFYFKSFGKPKHISSHDKANLTNCDKQFGRLRASFDSFDHTMNLTAVFSKSAAVKPKG